MNIYIIHIYIYIYIGRETKCIALKEMLPSTRPVRVIDHSMVRSQVEGRLQKGRLRTGVEGGQNSLDFCVRTKCMAPYYEYKKFGQDLTV